MTKKEAFQPTESELEILQLLWENGPSSVKVINDLLQGKRRIGYTTTLKMMQIMLEKSMLRREKSGRIHIYSPVSKASETRKMLLDHLLESAFGGSVKKLVMQALGNHRLSPEEALEIRSMIAKSEDESR